MHHFTTFLCLQDLQAIFYCVSRVTLVWMISSLWACNQAALTEMIQQQQNQLQQSQAKHTLLALNQKKLEQTLYHRSKNLLLMKKKQDFLINMLKEQEANFQLLRRKYNDLLTQPQMTKGSSSFRMLRSVNQNLLRRLAKEIGADSEKTSYGVLMRFGRVKTHVVFSQKNKVLMTQSRFKGFTPDLLFLNEWNRTRRFSRAYLETGGVVILESEVDLEQGMTQKALKSWLKSYGLLVNFFQLSMHKNEQIKQNKKPNKKKHPPSQSQPHSKSDKKNSPFIPLDPSKLQEI